MVSDAAFLIDGKIIIVLILVLMEYGLRLALEVFSGRIQHRLNPCSNGIWSLTRPGYFNEIMNRVVLILVLMEYGL